MAKKRHQSTTRQRQLVRKFARDLLGREPKLSVRQIMERARRAGIEIDWQEQWWAEQVRVARQWHGISVTRSDARANATYNYHLQKAELDIVAEEARHRPADPAEVQMNGAARMAAAVLRIAWDDADRILRPGFDKLSNGERARLKYAVAWLQSSDCTARWCDLLGVDPDMVASMSARKHGRPRFSRAEIEYLEKEKGL